CSAKEASRPISRCATGRSSPSRWARAPRRDAPSASGIARNRFASTEEPMRHHEIDETCARLRAVLEETRGLDRRDFLRALAKAGLAGVLSTAGAGLGSRARAAERPVTMLTYGGAWKTAIMEAYGDPFTNKTGIPMQYQEPYSWA